MEWRVLRALRNRAKLEAMNAALRCAPRLSARSIQRIRAGLAWAGPRCPVLARLVAENLRAAGVYERGVHARYFERFANHLAGAMLAFRQTEGAEGPNPDLMAQAAETLELDDSVELLRAAAARGRGVVLSGPHLVEFTTILPAISQVVPLSVFFRSSREPARRATKERWCAAGGMRALLDSEETTAGKSGRVDRMIQAVQAGEVVYITPDLPRKVGEGVPVRWLGRTVYLPPGAGVLAMRTGAPLFLLLSEERGARQRLIVRGPAPTLGMGEDRGRTAVQQHLQWFADAFETWLRAQPALWYSWADKRWTRVLRGDPEYVTPAVDGTAVDMAASAGGGAA